MRRLLTGGIKAILAIAALSTAAHWTMRLQREPSPRPVAALPDPVTTGSIDARKSVAGPAAASADVNRGLDQRRLSELFAGTAPEKAKVQKAAVKR
ncbi:hypothetical protein [Methylobacterium sp. Leaf112]|uniref:hypothetical protein n=1 Tax=Methylobacterium sp. Leaf112 TaxID=1736258 RepID=UPI0006F32BB2|nr:hypothetical protein [Methylobacterium sp. Leaf112]KQP72352.1 hypothetical protein ASF52_02205 [Methylobacterium sp. Leaf112]